MFVFSKCITSQPTNHLTQTTINLSNQSSVFVCGGVRQAVTYTDQYLLTANVIQIDLTA